ncbi:hypothetical protein PUNSTDRAFT_32940, partial [Punctularia strigosozonata HHB-11173 SS5]|uniref:uncharacterized protein n=1 Tax=Punctularia strigosozonata (strain HHB-11173) TaxID=741275 RepID=UPI00044171BA
VRSAWFAFILPGYSTFKALAHRPVSDPELEKWSQYWVVISLFVAFEYTLQWLISWLPFYWEIKTLFLLFLSLPQTQGSIYIYTAFVAPYIIANEADIDAGIERLKTQSLSFLHGRLAAAVDTVFKLLTKASTRQQAGDTSQVIPQQGGQQGQGTTPADASNYLGMANGLWRAYGPSVLGALQRGQQIATGGKPTAPGPNPSPSAST